MLPKLMPATILYETNSPRDRVQILQCINSIIYNTVIISWVCVGVVLVLVLVLVLVADKNVN
jgi:hypothetical protein